MRYSTSKIVVWHASGQKPFDRRSILLPGNTGVVSTTISARPGLSRKECCWSTSYRLRSSSLQSSSCAIVSHILIVRPIRAVVCLLVPQITGKLSGGLSGCRCICWKNQNARRCSKPSIRLSYSPKKRTSPVCRKSKSTEKAPLLKMGTLSPNPWDLPRFPPEWQITLGRLAPPCHSGRWVGARVASLRCPILRQVKPV